MPTMANSCSVCDYDFADKAIDPVKEAQASESLTRRFLSIGSIGAGFGAVLLMIIAVGAIIQGRFENAVWATTLSLLMIGCLGAFRRLSER